MAAPTVSSYIWDPYALTLTTVWSEAVTADTGWAVGCIDLTDIIGRRYENSNATLTVAQGSGTDTLVIPMALSTTAGETASTIDIAADAVQNAGEEANSAITNAAFYSTISNYATGLTRDDIDVFREQMELIIAGTLDPTASPQTENLTDIIDPVLLIGRLRNAPKTEYMAHALLTQWDKYLQSNKGPQALSELQKSVDALKASLNPSGTFALNSAGL